MINQRIEMMLPDETILIAEATEKSDYPSINIYHKDAAGDVDEVVFAEYNPEKEIGRKLMAAAYQNNDDDTRYFKPFHYVFKPTFKDLYQVYKDSEDTEFKLVQDGDFYEIIRSSDNLVIYRDFCCDNDKLKLHIGHEVNLAVYGGEDGIENVSIECLDCNEVLYSVKRKKALNEIYRMIQPRSLFDVINFASDSEKLMKYGCIGFSKIDFGPDGKGFNSEWTDKNAEMRTDRFAELYNELVNDYLCYNLLKSPENMLRHCTVSDKLLKIWDGMYVSQVVADDYTFFVVVTPKGTESEACIYAHSNEILYKQIDPFEFPAPANVDCEATVSYVKHLDSYKNPRITYLDDVEDECWNLFKCYAEMVGVKFGDGIDYTIAKEISEKIISLVERTFGVDFPLSKGG